MYKILVRFIHSLGQRIAFAAPIFTKFTFANGVVTISFTPFYPDRSRDRGILGVY
jgi:hypothetical protein